MVDGLRKWKVHESWWSIKVDGLQKRTTSWSKIRRWRMRKLLKSFPMKMDGRLDIIWPNQRARTGSNHSIWVGRPSTLSPLFLTHESGGWNHVSTNPEIINESLHLNKFFTDIWYCWCLLSKHIFHYFSHFFLNFLWAWSLRWVLFYMVENIALSR